MQSQSNDLSPNKDFLHHSWFWSPCIATPASILCKLWTREWKQTRASAHSAIVTYLCVSVWAEGGREAKSTFFSIAQLVASIVHFDQTQLWIQYNQCPINPYPLYLPKVLIFGSCYKGLWGWSVEELKANIFIAVFGLKTQQHQLQKIFLVGVPTIVYNFIGQNHLRMEVAPWTYMSDWEKSIQELFQLILYLI